MAPHGPQGTRGKYYHGDLRGKLIQAAMSMIAERGLAGFALSELARAVRVSGAAPYRHFRDRTAVIAEVARRGFKRLAADLEAARQAGGIDPIAALQRCAQAHLAFAGTDPPVYAAMFGASFPVGQHPDLLQAREAAFAVVREAAYDVSIHAGTSNRPPAQMMALHVWSMTHGIATLFIGRGNDIHRPLPTAPADLLEAGLMIYLQALGLS